MQHMTGIQVCGTEKLKNCGPLVQEEKHGNEKRSLFYLLKLTVNLCCISLKSIFLNAQSGLNPEEISFYHVACHALLGVDQIFRKNACFLHLKTEKGSSLLAQCLGSKIRQKKTFVNGKMLS